MQKSEVIDAGKVEPSRHREFFERIYGNLDKSQSYSLAEQLFLGTNDKSQENYYLNIKDNKSLQSSSCQQMTLFPVISYYTAPHVAPLSYGFSAFLARKKRQEGKVRRLRTTISRKQTLHLENEFRFNEYIPRTRRQEVAERLHLTEMQVKIWFQNRRAKDKRMEKAQLDQQYRNLILAQKHFMTPIFYDALRTSNTVHYAESHL